MRQYQKIQEKCLVAQDGQDFRTDENEQRRWSRHPLEKHASTVYTKNMFYKFSKEFEKTIEYDVDIYKFHDVDIWGCKIQRTASGTM